MQIECHSEKQRKIAENRLAKSCDSGGCKIGLSVGKSCKGVFVMEKSKPKELAEYITEQLAGLEDMDCFFRVLFEQLIQSVSFCFVKIPDPAKKFPVNLLRAALRHIRTNSTYRGDQPFENA